MSNTLESHRSSITSVSRGAKSLSKALLTYWMEMNDTTAVHRKIFKEVNERILPTLSADAECPPLHVLVYAVRNILFPSFIVDMTEDLLELLAHIETIRKRFISQVEELVASNRPGVGHRCSESRNMVSDTDWEYVKNIPKVLGGGTRSLYFRITQELRELHVYEAWCSSNPEEVDRLMQTYFPFPEFWTEESLKDCVHPLIHQEISEEEKAQLYKTCLDSLSRFEQYPDLDPASPSFREQHPPPVDTQIITDLVQQYLHTLEEAVEKVSNVLASTQ